MRMVGLAVLCAALVALPATKLHAETPLAAFETALKEALARDRFNVPAQEFEVWSTFAKDALQRDDLTPLMRSQIQLRLGISQYYLANYEAAAVWLDKVEAIVANAEEALPATFLSEFEAYNALVLTDSQQLDSGRKAVHRAFAHLGLSGAPLSPNDMSWHAALTLNAASIAYFKSGMRDEGAGYACEGARVGRAVLDDTDALRYQNIHNCGVLLYYQGDHRAGDILQDNANAIMARYPLDHPIMARAFNASYGVLMQLGRYPETAALARLHLDLERQWRGADRKEVYDPASILARALFMQGRVDEAVQIQRQAVALADTMKGNSFFSEPGNARIALASMLTSLGELGEAGPLFVEGIAKLKRLGDTLDENIASAEMKYALFLTQIDSLEEALPMAKQAYEALLNNSAPSLRERAETTAQYAVMLSRANRMPEARALASTAMAQLEEQLASVSHRRTSQVSNSIDLMKGFSLVAEVALRAGDDALAIKAVQLASASELSLASADVTARAVKRNAGFADLMSQVRTSRTARAKAQRQLNAAIGEGADNSVISKHTQDLAVASTMASDLEDTLQQRFPNFANMQQPSPMTQSELQGQLADDQALVFALETFDQTLTLIITRDNFEWALSGLLPNDVRKARQRILASLNAARLVRGTSLPAFDAAAAHTVFQAIFPGDTYETLTGKKRLVFSASGPLGAIPPALLVTKQLQDRPVAWLVKDYAVSIASTYNGIGAADLARKDTRFIGLGDPSLTGSRASSMDVAGVFRGGRVNMESLRSLPRLSGARKELKTMRKAFGRKQSNLFMGRAFTEQTVADIDFTNASVVAFATHGLTASELSGLTEPALVLTPPSGDGSANGDNNDGLLTASEIAQMAFPVDWVILSACNSGTGRSSTAPLYSGLAKAFRSAGARALLLSHWPVRDDAAAYLSIATVTNTQRGLPKAQALRQAQLALMADTNIRNSDHPLIWAPFVLIEN